MRSHRTKEKPRHELAVTITEIHEPEHEFRLFIEGEYAGSFDTEEQARTEAECAQIELDAADALWDGDTI